MKTAQIYGDPADQLLEKLSDSLMVLGAQMAAAEYYRVCARNCLFRAL
jgi:hypothetical protein